MNGPDIPPGTRLAPILEARIDRQHDDVSVVIPAYNAASFIIDALNSITSQVLLPKEVIVVNDGSSDQTEEVVREWISKSVPFRVLLHTQSNAGISVSRNVGIRQSTAAWVALLDADDIWEPTHLQELFNARRHVPDAVAAYGAGRLLVDGVVQNSLYDEFWDNPSRSYGKQIGKTPYFFLDWTAFPRLMKGNFIKPSSLIFRREATEEIGLFNEDLGTSEDREFLVRLLRKGGFVYCSSPITQYRWHDDNASQIKNARRNGANSLRALKVIMQNSSLKLDNGEIGACHRELSSATREFMYVCCKQGSRSYFSGLRFVSKLFGWRIGLHSVRIKQLVLSLFHFTGRAQPRTIAS